MSISEHFRYWNDSFQSDIFVSDIGITDVDVGCWTSPTLWSMSMPTYASNELRLKAQIGPSISVAWSKENNDCSDPPSAAFILTIPWKNYLFWVVRLAATIPRSLEVRFALIHWCSACFGLFWSYTAWSGWSACLLLSENSMYVNYVGLVRLSVTDYSGDNTCFDWSAASFWSPLVILSALIGRHFFFLFWLLWLVNLLSEQVFLKNNPSSDIQSAIYFIFIFLCSLKVTVVVKVVGSVCSVAVRVG
jgi:hypothetical protein